MKSSFPKCHKCHSKKWVCNANANFVDCVLEKSSAYIHMYIYIFIYEELFFKARFPNMAFALQAHFFGRMALIAFWKRVLYMFLD